MASSSKVSALVFVVLLCISSVSPILACNPCSTPVNPPKTPIHFPPVGGVLPPVGQLPPAGGVLPPGGQLPPVGRLPPLGQLPPVGGVLPPVGGMPPITKPGPTPCAPTPKVRPPKCPINTLELVACVDLLLGGAVPIGFGHPLTNACCPVLEGLVEVEAAVCLCTCLKAKVLNLTVYVPIALQLLLSCGKTLPPGFTCFI